MNHVFTARPVRLSLVALAICLVSATAMANPSQGELTKTGQKLYDFYQQPLTLHVLAGIQQANFDAQDQIVFPADSFRTDRFQSTNDKTNFTAAIGISRAIKTDTLAHIQAFHAGLFTYFGQGIQQGSVYEYGLTNFNNATYEMKVRSYRFMLTGEAELNPLSLSIIPFIEAGFGFAHHVMSFENNPRPNIGVDGGYYHLNRSRNTKFAYQLGIGVKKEVTDHSLVSVRYLYADTGRAKSATADSQTGVQLASPIHTKVRSNALYFGYSYLMG